MIKTDFHNDKIPKEKTPYKCLSLIKLESILRTKESYYYSQTFLEECGYDEKIIKRNRHIDCDFQKMNLIVRLIVSLIVILMIIMNLIIINLKSLLGNLIIMNLKSLINLLMINLKTLF